jgi:hypothetical protein
MKNFNTIPRLLGAGIVGVIPFALSASAQTTTSPTTSSTTSPPPATTVAPNKPTSATPRSAKARDQGVPERWGSEEPFTYVPR